MFYGSDPNEPPAGKLTPEELAERTAGLVGYHYTVDDYYEVGREEVRKHAMSVQDAHPTHWNEAAAAEYGHDSLLAAPTFVSVFGITAQRYLFEEVIKGYDLWQIMQTDQRLIYHQPMKVGDQLICDVSLESFRHISQPENLDMLVSKNIIWNQHDEPVMTTYTSLVARTGVDVDPALVDSLEHVMITVDAFGDPGKTVDRPAGQQGQPDPTESPVAGKAIDFDSLTVGQELPPKSFLLTRGNLVNYAGVVGDPNPIHYSDEIVKAAGLDGVVAHGMQTMGLGATYVSEFIGDPGAFCEYNVRFTSPVYVPADDYTTVEFTAKIKSLDPETRKGTIALVAKQADRRIFGRATVVVQFN
ncbi:MAG TPA: fused (3R)-hydroxyacyl-ACP dehydratase subunits HadA/HadB [Gordonia sp. (in: high G+C Gram-positive bacteria)]|uniref:fused (3R)-hydroxyacyl-ACP dehydratase subunits HadA/HadB n=1 Tax=unclassified Gordonia (in: high G+C Gram-positive bacteria) TaxID=2657482 RepID=UPI000FBEC21E|nr:MULTISPECIES: fused (3R)-hydroxyacyl-ACP dehydratase subunits HadA/HadB [unclassified Gordonia (in: high G+C Gram-positive bacteria)]RUP39632.1 MAG: (R)-hydratase [Gordonia sp. (in: high G+C Gram-positive bacteria)]HNP56896.1 fused (3R)-hydroxyacyl-ACP dehydratase subunits HadA/HadB [Gordonia sp. (in: high G+C Gram-positive bacteria)]HRC51147.1 fused (3R)-hydroxyacyl-ACP dehydratase subunits HadA/HadB [Gordonia sp. (in: high G+C Gram-positive bacteria)]